jgi:hypothetical protein
MIEEKPFLDAAGPHFSILGEVNGGLCNPAGLAARIDAIHVRFVLLDSDVSVQDRRHDEEEHRTQQNYQWTHAGSPTLRICQTEPHRRNKQSSPQRWNPNAATAKIRKEVSDYGTWPSTECPITACTSSGEPLRTRLSLSVMRMVFPKPLTFALIRVVCFEASAS